MVETRTTSASQPSNHPKITIRPASLADAPACAKLATKTYYNSPLTVFLYPYREKYYTSYERAAIHRSWKRLLDPRNQTFLAVLSSDPSVRVGYASFVRLGNDSGAKRQIKNRGLIWLRLLGWAFAVYLLIVGWVLGGDKSIDPERLRVFDAYAEESKEQYWRAPDRTERWHAQSVVVSPEFQGQGIGKMLMAEAIARAEEEGVVIGLEATGAGERLYRRIGFDMLGRFREGFGEASKEGGIMLYTPGKLRKSN